MCRIELLTIPGDENNDLARKELGKLDDVEIEEAVCGPGAREVYRMPCIRVEPGIRAFGLENIRSFVSFELARAASAR